MEVIDNKRTSKIQLSDEKVDIREILSRKVVDTTVNKIIFRVKEVKGKKSDIWSDFVDNINQNNMLDRIIRSDIKMKSKFGRTYVGFDIWKNKIKIGIADNSTNNQSLRINGLEQYAILVDRTYSTYNGGAPVLKNQLVLTQNTISYLFIGGLGISNNDTKDINSSKNFKETKKEVLGNGIPLTWASVKIPQYVVDNFKIGTHKHKYGVLPCVEMLNKELIDTDAQGIEPDWENKASDVFYSDGYPAKELIKVYNDFVNFFYEELQLDHTRVMGMFSNQDMNGFEKFKKGFKSALDRIIHAQSGVDEETPEENIIKKKLILKSIGTESNMQVMQTTFRGVEHVQTLENLTTYIFKICGYSWDENNGSVYENVSQTMNSSKGIYETTKSKISLFERQWGEFFARTAYAYLKDKTPKFASVGEAYEDFKKNVEFKIISNVLQQENNDGKKIMELKQSDLISTRKAIKDINPELTADELESEVAEIEENKKSSQPEFPYFDDHEDKPNENPAYDNNGEVKQDE